MKKTAALLLVLIMLMTSAACSPLSSGQTSGDGDTLQSIEMKQDGFNLFSRADVSSAEAVPVSDIPAGNISELGSVSLYDPSSVYPASDIFEPQSQDICWCYNEISGKQRDIYLRMDKIARDMYTGFVIIGDCEMSDIVVAFSALRTDHPEYYWLSNRFSCGYYYGQTAIAFDYRGDGIDISYLCTKDERDKYNADMCSAIEEIIAPLSADMSEYDVELALHDALLSRVNYDKAAEVNGELNPMAFTAYGALVGGSAVCEGYSRAFQLLLNFCGVESTLAIGSSQGQGHMWNKVKIGGEWYNTDATWDDGDEIAFHSYFNITDKMLASDHSECPGVDSLSKQQLEDFEDFNISVPPCTAVADNFGVKGGTYIESDGDFADVLVQGLYRSISAGDDSAEFIFGEDTSYTFSSGGDGSVTELMKAHDVVSKVNKKLSRSRRISNIFISGIPGSKGFTLTW